MNIAATPSAWEGAGLRADLRVGATSPSFAEQLHIAGASGREELEEAAGNLVSSALVLPALASMHESPLRPKSGPFAPGSAEKRFAPLLEQQFADRITKAARFGLVDVIVNRFANDRSAMK